MQITFKNTCLVIITMLLSGVSVETQCMRRMLPVMLRRAYSLPRISPEGAQKIIAIDKDIAEQKLQHNQIYRARVQAILNDIKTVSFYTALFGSCYVPIYGLKSLLVSGGITAALVPFIIASYPLTPYDKRQIKKYTSTIQALEEKKVALFNEHSEKN